MPGIYIAALLVGGFVFSIFLIMLFQKRTLGEGFWLALTLLFAGCMYLIAFYAMRVPFITMVSAQVPGQTPLAGILATLYAPMTEEPAKLLAVLPALLFGRLRKENLTAFALAAGLGFGIGEIIFLANLINGEVIVAGLPWYSFSGFILERFMVCFIHAGLVLIFLKALVEGRLWMLSVPIMLHWLLNLPIFLAARFPIEPSGIVWQEIIWLWVILACFAAISMLISHSPGKDRLTEAITGRAVCPECGALYIRPLVGVNRLRTRYERCPQCGKWHWTTLYSGEKKS